MKKFVMDVNKPYKIPADDLPVPENVLNCAEQTCRNIYPESPSQEVVERVIAAMKGAYFEWARYRDVNEVELGSSWEPVAKAAIAAMSQPVMGMLPSGNNPVKNGENKQNIPEREDVPEVGFGNIAETVIQREISLNTPEAAADIRHHIEKAFKWWKNPRNEDASPKGGSEVDLQRYLYSQFDLLMRKYATKPVSVDFEKMTHADLEEIATEIRKAAYPSRAFTHAESFKCARAVFNWFCGRMKHVD